MTDNLHIHGQRAVRNGCKFCGMKGVRWAHDLDAIRGIGDHCDECGIAGRMIVANPDGTRHECRKSTAAKPVPAEEAPVPAVVDAPAVSAPAEGKDTGEGMPDAMRAFQSFLELVAPKVDRAEVESMIREQIDATVFPTTTIVERATGERVELEGTTHHAFGEVMTAAMCGLHVMMVGPAGTGKSTIAEQVAEALSVSFRFIACHPAMTPTALIGFVDANGTYHRTGFRECFENGGVFLFDEIDNSHPSILAAMNAALANGYMEFPDGTHVKAHADFRVMAAANTFGRGADRKYVGRQQLDAATLDRFFTHYIGVDETLETAICNATGATFETVDRVLSYTRKLRRNAEEKGMMVVISPRASVGMCKLLTAGATWDMASQGMVLKGMSDADRVKIGA